MPRNVVFVAPFPLETTMRFVRAVAKLPDVRLLGVVHTPPAGADRKLFHDIVRVTDPLSGKDILDATRVLQRRHGEVHRIVGILEAIQVQIAEAREAFAIPGTSPRVAELFRDKSKMKAALREAGLPVAKSALLTNGDDARAFAARCGFPMVLKPPAGMGAKATFRVNDLGALLRSVSGLGTSRENPVLAEEFLKGREFSFETVTIDGKPRTHSISHYLPSCLDVLENDWIQWCCLLPREIGAEYNEARKIGFGAIEALGLDDGFTHMEWFQREDGSLVIGEIAQRPPGANITRMTGLAHDIDPYRAWARAVVNGSADERWDRKYAVGCAYLRGQGQGRVSNVTGIHETYNAIKEVLVEADLPTVGKPKSDSYEGDGYVIVRHPDTEVVKRALKIVVETMRIHYR
jgi:biotin carboxylase